MKACSLFSVYIFLFVLFAAVFA